MNKTELIKIIKQKKELSGISDSIILETLEKYLSKNKINPASLKKPQLKIIIKEIRADLRISVGQFQKSLKNKSTLLKKGKIEELLQTHTSTSERLSFYPKLKKIISTLNIKSILDIGCGLNPIALAEPDIIYYASEINEENLKLINDFFKKNKIKGKTFVYDLRKPSHNLPRADLCLIMKVLDLIERKKTQAILRKINCKYFLISFSTRKLSGKSMTHPKRNWFERILNELDYPFKIIQSENEIFYLINKAK